MNRSLIRLVRHIVAAVITIFAGSAWALDQSLGPHLDQPFLGPNGARITIVKLADTYNLDGTGVILGQLELSEPRRTHVTLVGGMPAAANLHGVGPPDERNHASEVAYILIGRTFDDGMGNMFPAGIASNATLFSTGFDDTAGDDGEFFGDANWLRDRGVRIINMSARFAFPGDTANGQSAIARFADQFVRANNIVWVKSAGNSGPGATTLTLPADAFNVITVGRTGAAVGAAGAASQDYTRVFSNPADSGSSRGPTADGRHKPDLVAPGSLIRGASGTSDTGSREDSGTSFAAPHVAGTAALLDQYAAREGIGRDHLMIKAAILNSTSKHVRDPRDMDRSWPEWRANNYTTSGVTTFSGIPLNDGMGVGQLNGLAALRQYVGDTRSDRGLRIGEVAANDKSTYQLYTGLGTETLKPGSLVTATLTWDRNVTLNNAAKPSETASYTVTELPNLNLELVDRATGAVVYRAQSGGNADANKTGGDNVEHIYFNVPVEGNYDLVVRNRSDGAVRHSIAWSSGTSNGPAFSVDHGAEGRQASTTGTFPNDVNALGRAGPGNFPIGGEIFTSSMNGTNIERISGALGTRSRVGPHNGPPAAINMLDNTARGVLGLAANDNVNGLSWGFDGTSLLGLSNADSALVFSVDGKSKGAMGTDVHHQAVVSGVGGAAPMKPFPDNVPGGDPGGEAAGDIYVSQRFAPFGKYLATDSAMPANPNSNSLLIDEGELGLQAPRTRGALDTVTIDDLDALEMTTPLFVDRDGDGMHGDQIFFTLDKTSPTIMGGGAGFAVQDILVSAPADATDAQFDLNPASPFAASIKYADGVTNIGLKAGDVIDALALSDLTPVVGGGLFLPFTDGIVNPALDEALFSLAPGSPTLALFSLLLGRTLSAADVFYTNFTGSFNVFATAEQLGLLPGGTGFGGVDLGIGDNLDALDVVRAVPEPSARWLLIVGAGYGLSTRRSVRPIRQSRH